MPTLTELESDLYRRLGFAATPDPVVTTRLRAYLNQTHREILSQKGLSPLRAGIVEVTSTPGDPYLAINQAAVRVATVVDRMNRRVLRPVPLTELREVDPGRNTTASVPDSFAVINLLTASTKPSTQAGLSLRSTSTLDNAAKTAYFQVVVPSGDPHGVEGTALNGTTPVNAPSPWPIGSLVTKFYMNVAADGFVYIHEGLGGTGAILATIGSGRTTTQKTLLQLSPTPQTAITYHVDVEYRIHEMSISGDAPLLPEDFHWVLTSGALLKEWQRMEKTAQYDREKQMYREGIGDLKMFVARAQKADGKNGNGNGLHDSSFGPWYPIGGVGSAAPHAPTHEPGGNDPMTVDALPTIASLRTLGSGPNQAAPGDDPRFTSGGGGPHHLTHESGGTDALSVLLLAGYPGGSTGFLRSDATFATPATGGGAHHTTHETGGTDAIVALSGAVITTGTVADARLSTNVQMKPIPVTDLPNHATRHQPGGADAMAVDAVPATGSLRTLGTGANQAAPGNDSRFTAGGIPHHATHEPGGSDAMAVDAAAATGSLRTLGTTGTSACAGNDTRLTNNRAPTAHASTHQVGGLGTDVVDVKLLGGYPGGTTNFLRADGTFQPPPTGGGPGAHATTHQPGGSDPMAVDAAAATGSLRTLGTGANQAAPGNDTRFTAAPQAHHASHEPGGGDVLANNAWTNVANTFTQNQTIQTISAQFELTATAQAANQKRWVMGNLGNLLLYPLTDAGAGTGVTPLTLTRTGDATVGNNLTATGSGGNVACKDQANTFTVNQTVQFANPNIILNDTAPPVNARMFAVQVSAQRFRIDSLTDGYVYLNSPLQLDRVGNALISNDIYEKGRATPMGHWTDMPYSAANFSASGGTWTVPSHYTYAYELIGKTMWLSLYLASSTIGGTPGYLVVSLPAGFSIARTIGTQFAYFQGGAAGTGWALGSAGGGGIALYRDILGTLWVAGTCHLQVTIPINIV